MSAMTPQEFSDAMKSMAIECKDKKPRMYYYEILLSETLMAKGFFISGEKEAEARVEGIRRDIIGRYTKAIGKVE